MKKLILLLGMGMLLPTAANADLVHRLTTSTQLTVDGAATQSTRIGSTYSVSGNNIKVASADDHFGKLTAPSGTAAATLDAVHTILILQGQLSALRKVLQQVTL